jgi:hypothetical protein
VLEAATLHLADPPCKDAAQLLQLISEHGVQACTCTPPNLSSSLASLLFLTGGWYMLLGAPACSSSRPGMALDAYS